jgi:hypothetical protein
MVVAVVAVAVVAVVVVVVAAPVTQCPLPQWKALVPLMLAQSAMRALVAVLLLVQPQCPSSGKGPRVKGRCR